MQTSRDPAAEMLGYALITGNNQDLAKVEVVWRNQVTGTAEFVGVRLGLIFKHLHAIPLDDAEVDRERRLVRVQYLADTMRNTKKFLSTQIIRPEEKWVVKDQFGLKKPTTNPAGGVQSQDQNASQPDVDLYASIPVSVDR